MQHAPLGIFGDDVEVVSGAAQFELRTLEASLVVSMYDGACAIDSIDSVRDSVRSVLSALVPLRASLVSGGR
eukprot:7448085-Alexandrium_andersonii.AAC.1